MDTRSPAPRPAPPAGSGRPAVAGDPPPRAAPAAAAHAGATRLVAIVVEPFPLWLAARRAPDLARTPLVACDEGRVLHANPAARRRGIERGMRLTGARLRASGLQLAASDEPGLAQGWRELVRELLGWTPWLEAARRGRAFARLGEDEAAALAARLNARVGVADDLETAELAALAARPGQARRVAPGAVDAFLRRLPLRFLRGVGLAEGDLTRLHWLGLVTAGDLAGWRAAQLRAFLGEAGEALLPYLHGPRRRRLGPWQAPTVLRRTLAFERPLFEPADLEPALDRLARSLALELGGRAARHVTVATEGGGGARRASRLAKRPLRAAGQIRQQALFALRDTGAAAAGIEGLTVELAAPERFTQAVGLWDARQRQEAAVDAVLERYPHALARVRWGDPHAPAADRAWRWTALEDGAAADAAPAARRHRGGPASALLEAAPGAVAPAVLHAAPPLGPDVRPAEAPPGPHAPPPGAALPYPTARPDTPRTPPADPPRARARAPLRPPAAAWSGRPAGPPTAGPTGGPTPTAGPAAGGD